MNEALDLAVLFVHPPIAEPPRHENRPNDGNLPMMVRDMLQLLVSTHDVVRYRSVMAKIPMNTRLGSPYV